MFCLQVLAILQATFFWWFYVLFGMRKWMIVVSTKKEKIVNHNFIFKKISGRIIVLFLGKPRFFKSLVYSDSGALLKCKIWLKCQQEIIYYTALLYHFFLCKSVYKKFCHFLQIPESLHWARMCHLLLLTMPYMCTYINSIVHAAACNLELHIIKNNTILQQHSL